METLLVVGGCRSGKSAVAMQWALRRPGPRAYVATARPSGMIDPLAAPRTDLQADPLTASLEEWDDPEMRARIARHQAERGPEWRTLLACEDGYGPLLTAEDSLSRAAGECRVAVFDSVGMWLAGVLDGRDDAEVLERVRALARCLENAPLPVALVSDEVGMGLAPTTPLGRRFRDLQGEANQILAAACCNVAFCACGLPLVLKGRLE